MRTLILEHLLTNPTAPRRAQKHVRRTVLPPPAARVLSSSRDLNLLSTLEYYKPCTNHQRPHQNTSTIHSQIAW